MAVLFPIVFWFELTDDEFSEALDYFDYLFWLIALIGVFGYCYGKRILTKKFWQIFLPFIIIWDLFIAFYEIDLEPELQEPILLSIVIIIYFVILLPEYIGLYLYSYKNQKERT